MKFPFHHQNSEMALGSEQKKRREKNVEIRKTHAGVVVVFLGGFKNICCVFLNSKHI
jgi:hypothetical protein